MSKSKQKETYTVVISGLDKSRAKLAANAVWGMYPERAEVEILVDVDDGEFDLIGCRRALKSGATEILHF